MSTPQLYRQLQTQLSQWIAPKDKRHLTIFAENIAAILQAQSGCLSHWPKYLSHRSFQISLHRCKLLPSMVNALGALNPISRITSLLPLSCLVLV
jgi:hypothetical protein